MTRFSAHRWTRPILALVAAGVLSACAQQGPALSTSGENDPLEPQNRAVHEFNRKLDRAVLRPLSSGYVNPATADLVDSVANFSDNLSLPGVIVNNILQGDLESATQNTVRFVFNSTLGIGGLFDPAGDIGIAERDTDFGETLHVWGMGEGAYLELPFFGPSTTRDAVGTVADFFTNPLTAALPSPEKHIGTAAKVMSKVGSRGKFSQSIDSVLYDSADSYSQSRLLYLQNRRYELGGASSDAYLELYDDPYDE